MKIEVREYDVNIDGRKKEVGHKHLCEQCYLYWDNYGLNGQWRIACRSDEE